MDARVPVRKPGSKRSWSGTIVRHVTRAILTSLLMLLCVAPAAHALTQVPGLVRELIGVPGPDGSMLEALLTRPAAPARHPVAIVSHGAPRDGSERLAMRATGLSAVSIELARRGWAVLAPLRRGYGLSTGRYAESYGSCETPRYRDSALTAAQDILAAVEAMQARGDTDAGRVLLVGHSAGGLSSIGAASLRPAGLVGVINVAGGRGSTGPDEVCREDLLAEAFGSLGRTVRVPTLWLYAENDRYFGPDLARAFFAAFTAAGGTGELAMLPPFGEDGHTVFNTASGLPRWLPAADAFLARHGIAAGPPVGALPVPRLPPPPGLSQKGRAAFEEYAASRNLEKAFAVSGGGAYGWRTGYRTPEDAARAAVETCSAYGAACVPYAVNDRLIGR